MKNLLSVIALICLSFSAFNSIAQPNWGSEWKFYTSEFIYDGEYFENQKIKSNYVRSAALDADGSVWIAVGGEIQIFSKGKVNTLRSKDFGSPRYINALRFDSNNTLWIGTNQGLYSFNGSEFQYVKIPEISNVSEIAIDKNDHVYVAGFSSDAINATGGGVSVYNGSEWVNYNEKNSDLPRRFVEDMTFDNDGNLWMVAGFQDFGVTMFDGTKWVNYNTNNSGIPSNVVRAIDFDSEGNAWFGTPKGLIKYDGSTWTQKSLKEVIYGSQFSALTKFVDEPDLLSIAIDDNDVLWIGTDGNGVIRIQGKAQTVIDIDNSPMTTNFVREIVIDEQNRKWFVTGSYPENWSDRFFKDYDNTVQRFGGLVMYQDPNYDNFENWKVFNTFTSDQPGNYFYDIQRSSNGAMWMASQAFGIVEYDDGNWNVYQDPNRGNIGEMLICLTVGEDGEAYAGAQMKGLYGLNGKDLESLPKEEFGYDNKNITDLEFDDDGNLWIATIAAAEKCKDGKCELFNKKNGLLANNIFAIKKDSKGRMWVCTTKGISRYDNGTWTHYDKKNNGLNGYIYDVAEDKDGNFWAASGKGLFKQEGENWLEVEPIGDVPKYLTIKRITFDNDGLMWIGTQTTGVLTYDGTHWEHYNWENSGVIFSQVWDIEIAENGNVWISVEKGGTIAKSNSYTAGGTTPTGPDPGYELKQKMEKFDPSAALVVFKKN